MRNKILIVCFCIVVLVASGSPAMAIQQETETGTEPAATVDGDVVTQIFKTTFADVEDIASVISLFGGRVRANPDLGVFAWTGPASLLSAVEAAVRSLDVAPVPEPNVELTVYFLMATKGGPGKSDVPASLDGVAVQLEDVFGYDSVQLIETTVLRTRHGSRGGLNGILPRRLADDREARYDFGFQRVRVTNDESGRSIRLDGLNANIQASHNVVVDGQATTRDTQTAFSTDIDLREGQKAVIGKTSIEGGAAAVFIVVTGTIIK